VTAYERNQAAFEALQAWRSGCEKTGGRVLMDLRHED
jgi:hypothetical protein